MPEEKKTIYLSLRQCKWEDFTLSPNVRIPFLEGVRGSKGSIGFLEVFATYEDALAHAEGRAESVVMMEGGGG